MTTLDEFLAERADYEHHQARCVANGVGPTEGCVYCAEALT
jgi:hypothetical protein